MNKFAAICGSILLASSAASERPFPIIATLEGIASVKDGDGLLFGDVEVRLQGIAAPEDRRGKVDSGGKAATAALEALASGKYVVCYLDGSTANRRPVGVCEVAGVDLGRAMVRNGFARDCPFYSGGRYAEDEANARADGSDLWFYYALPGYC